MRIALIVFVLSTTVVLAGCVCASPCPPTRCVTTAQAAPTPPPTLPENATHALYDGRLGTPTTLDDFYAEALGTELVVFGELHGHPVGAEYELALLEKLGESMKPVALAMEFFERDTQVALDAYLAGEMDEATFMKETRRNKAFAATHGPLIAWAKANGANVIAANAPRRLVSGYRNSDLDYDGYVASLDEADRGLLPRSTSVIEDAYWERFAGMMGGERARPFFRSQSLWDDAMAESMADYLDAHPGHRVLFVVGAFHVTEGLGTITKFLQRRPKAKVSSLVMSMTRDGNLGWSEDDHHAGSVVLKVHPPKRRGPTGPNPHRSMPKPKAVHSNIFGASSGPWNQPRK